MKEAALTGRRALGASPGQIYWVSTDKIWAANLDGTSPHTIVTGQNSPSWMAVTPAAELSFSSAPYDYGSVPRADGHADVHADQLGPGGHRPADRDADGPAAFAVPSASRVA